MDTTIDYYDLLSDEVISHIAQFLDVVSLFKLSGTSRRLSVFKDISNTQWQKFYAERWHVDERELTVYTTIAWQDTYKTRIEAEKSYIRKIEAARLTEPPKQENSENKQEKSDVETNVSVKTNPETGKEEAWFKPFCDPWYTLLTTDDFEAVDNAMGQLDTIFGLPFTNDDIQREVKSRRFEILVTALTKLAPKHPKLLSRLPIFETLLVSEAFKDFERPIGLVGLLASLLDVKTELTVLDTAAYCIWRVAQSSPKTINDFFNALDIIPKLINVIEKCEDHAVVNSCIGALTWYKSKHNRIKFFQNGTFPKRIVQLLKEVPKTEGLDYECVIKVLYKLAPENAKECLQEGILEILFNIVRGANTQRKHISYALGALHNFSFFSDEVCFAISGDETSLPTLLNLLGTKGDFEKEIVDSILYVINDVALSETGVEKLLELNALDNLLPLLNSPNTSYYSSIYNVLNGSVDFSNMNGFLPEVTAKITPYFQVLVDHWDVSSSRASATNFWLTYTCATSPPREVSKKLIEKVMKQLQVEKRLDSKRDIVMLLANTVEVDKLAFEGLNMTNLYKFLSDNLVNHDSEKEKVEMMKLEIEKMYEQAALRRNNEFFGEDSGPSDLMDVVETEQIETDVPTRDMSVNGVAQDQQKKEEDEDNSEEEVVDTDMPWPLSLLSYLMQFEELKQMAVKDTKLLNKMLALYRDKQQRLESHFLVVFFWSNLINIPGWDKTEALECIEDFGMQAMWNMRWSFMFSYIEPYMHFFNKDNPTPIVLLASWFLAHMSTTEPGRKGCQKLDPNAIKWMDTYPHSRVEFNMTQFHNNMKKRSRK